MNNNKIKNSDICAICGVSGLEEQLIYAHLTPKCFQKGTRNKNDLIKVCRSCDTKLDFGMKEIEFIDFLYEVLRKSNKYDNVFKEPKVGKDRKMVPDLIMTNNSTNIAKKYVIECKSNRAYSRTRNERIIEYLKEVGKLSDATDLIFAFPSRIPDEAKLEFNNNNINVWDIDYIANEYSEQIKNMPDSIYKSYFMIVLSTSLQKEEKTLLDELEECKPGRSEWYVYQKIVGKILEELFCPPLNKPIAESSDGTRTNRRDYILANYSTEGFWRFMREKYSADYVVVDAKNYNAKIKKKDILQISNYLKSYGAGLFAIIFSRKGGDMKGCYHTIREQWMSQGKLIIILDDYDVKSMLKAGHRKGVEDIIGTKIEEFRLSM